MQEALFRSAVGLALAWRWPVFAAALLIDWLQSIAATRRTARPETAGVDPSPGAADHSTFGLCQDSQAEPKRGIPPKSLCGSGATWLYQMTEDIERIQWHGRWQQRRTLEH